MAILNQTPIPLAEVKNYLHDSEEKRQIDDYLKKFAKAPKGDVKQFIEDLRALNNPKMKESDFIKVVDLLPQDAEDVNKIFNDVSMSEEESQAIVGIVKNYS